MPPIDLAEALASHSVLGLLPPSHLETLAQKAERQEYEPGQVVITQGDLANRLALIMRGSVTLQDKDLGHDLQLEAGEWLGAGFTPLAQQRACQVLAADSAEVAFWPADVFETMRPSLEKLEPAMGRTAEPDAPTNLLSMPLRTLLHREPVSLAPSATILDAAQLMRDQGVSSVMLVQQGQLFGLITDRDLRNRVIAEGLDSNRPVADIATLAPLTIDLRQPAFEALLLMTRHNIHHIPVMDGASIAGMVTTSNLTEQHSTSAVYMASDIFKQTTVDGLAKISQKLKSLQQNLAHANASAYSTGHIITSITDALTKRLIHLAETQLGPAPVDFVWVAAGSQARCEQTAKSDQDNCMILDDRYDATLHGEYFRDFSRFVCDGLDACGFIHCPGEMMAMTDTWRQPQRRWAQYFHQWVDEPEPMALMLTSVFFDLRAIHGKNELLDTLRRDVLHRTRGNSLFLSYMVGNALKLRPPLGMFGQLSRIRRGEHADTVDLKHTGIAPIVDLARVYALSGGLEAVNTHDRLELAAQSGEVSVQGAHDLRDALEFLSQLRIAHQTRQTSEGQPPDNYLSLREISNFERTQLKDAFAVVQTLQRVLGQRYQ